MSKPWKEGHLYERFINDTLFPTLLSAVNMTHSEGCIAANSPLTGEFLTKLYEYFMRTGQWYTLMIGIAKLMHELYLCPMEVQALIYSTAGDVLCQLFIKKATGAQQLYRLYL
eukprot:scaffold2831_cov249-Ochromonas_danica.AAC.11